MYVFVLKRMGLAFLVALFVSLITFLMLRAAGDPAIAMAGEGASEADIEFIRVQFGFDRPLITQYLDWLSSALLGDFGTSTYFTTPVSELIAERLPVTLKLGLASLIFAIVLATPLGILAAVYPNSIIDRAALALSVLGQALPNFWFALMLIVVFSVMWPILPPSGNSSWINFIMPTMVLGYYATPSIMRLTRSGMLEVLRSDYIRTARAKGLLPVQIMFKHALRNAILPVVSLSTVQFGYMLGGSIIIESIFALHGIGQLAWESISRADLPTVQAIVLIISLIYVGLNLAGDLINAWLDPRIRVS
ncbi:MAG: ABC transporter permease [Rhodobacteraceae bacterium]|nr:ABC transporter permease [Paracoccaceae bacterium]MCY4250318.1 ABC transporter permease [Paracoccaceae bacterium]